LKTKTYSKNITLSIVGAIMVLASILLAIFYTVPQSVIQAVPFTLGGIGLISFIAGINGLNIARMTKNDDKFAKQVNDFNDERAAAIDVKSKASTNEFTNILFHALIVFLAVMQVQLAVLLVFVGSFFVRIFVSFYFVKK